jgi:hypothetical protein
MLAAQQQRLEQDLSSILAQLNERTELCRQLQAAQPSTIANLNDIAAESEELSRSIRTLLEIQWVVPNIGIS